ncbi:hypothetical protein [Paeniglutamicibacter gangotriensis]|uniref:Uncharacterized protein n=1 Tax=Paeniglutamicibacter gangotriensis Lz1y TaxID=1276920 RepID=M7MRC8_9MICC|nr:hypothetical protein [Paeniglutamicibacter gangotriensis]EMQ97596.1 hypothetical protein ADIAG_02976 [Paeniglutamicibacter gangotriensis Lz1y]
MSKTKSMDIAATERLESGLIIAVIFVMIAGLVVWITGKSVIIPWFFTADRLAETSTLGFEFYIGFPGVIAFGLVCAVAAVLFNRRSRRLASAA